MEYVIRPLGRWTDPVTRDRQGSGRFKAGWQSTLDLLAYETEQLGAALVVIQVDVQESQIRRDGMLKATARVGEPGVIVSFESRFGPLRYATDRYEQRWSGDPPGWQANIRAIALGLEALRAVDRYGVTRRGEQYRGWAALPASQGGSSQWFTTRQEAAQWMARSAGALGITAGPASGVDEPLYKALAKRMHPDPLAAAWTCGSGSTPQRRCSGCGRTRVPDIDWFAPGADPREWEGDVHTLIVHSVGEPVSQFDPGELDYDIEHAPSCKQEDRGYDGKTVMAWTCDVADNEGDVGLAWSLQYSGTPVTEPGTYRIRGWGRKYLTELGDEYDGGVAVIPEENEGA